MTSDNEVLDNLMLMLIQKAGGVEELLETFFSFLGRRTDFFKPPDHINPNHSLDHCIKLVTKYCRQAGAIAIEKRRKEEEESKKRLMTTTNGTKKLSEDDCCSVQHPNGSLPMHDTSSAHTKSNIHSSSSKSDKDTVVDGNDEIDSEVNDVPDSEDGSPPLGNGGSTEWYTWTQTLTSLEVMAKVPPGTSSKSVKLNVTPSKLHVFVDGVELFGGELHDLIKSDECLWVLVDGKTLQISLEKRNGMHWWPCVIKGHAEIDVKTIVPENSKLEDLDPETRATVERMMFDQRQKAAGLPTSSQSSQYEAFQKFKAAHPELDFSKANITYS